MKSAHLIFQKLILLFVFTIPIAPFLSVKILVIIFLLSLFIVKSRIRELRQSIDVIAYLIVLSVGLLYSTDLRTGLKVIETNFSFLAIPIMLCCITPINEKNRNELFYSFIIGLTIACIVLIANAVVAYLKYGDIHVFFAYQFTELIHFHPTYLAYYLIFAITFGLYLLYYQKSELRPLLIVAIIVFLFLILMLTGGQTAFISMLFVFSFFILKFLIEKRSMIGNVTFFLTGMMLICLFIFSSLSNKNGDLTVNDSWERFVLWEAALKATPDIILGVGTGDYKQVLNDYYITHNLKQFAGDSYNSHNQFIQIMLTNGILGVISVLVLICRPLYLAVKNQNILGILVFFPFLIYGTTEVFLGRYQGVVFFALLHQVFMSYYSSLKPSLTPLKGV